jgi:hypothetical protein
MFFYAIYFEGVGEGKVRGMGWKDGMGREKCKINKNI